MWVHFLDTAPYLTGGVLSGVGELHVDVVGFEVGVGVQVVELLPVVLLEEEVHPRSEVVELVLVVGPHLESHSESVVEEFSLVLKRKKEKYIGLGHFKSLDITYSLKFSPFTLLKECIGWKVV